MPDSASQRQEVTRDEGLDRNPVPRDDSVDTIAAVHDVEEALPTSKPVDVAPDGGYGWVCVACVFLINAHTWGVNSSYGVFLANYLQFDIFPGASYLEFAFVGGLSISLALGIAPLATICVGRFGTKTALLIGICFQFAGLLGASWTNKIWQLFLSQGVAYGFGMGFLFVASVGIVPQWFDKKRSFANSIGTAGSGFGGLTYSLATNAMIQTIGLGWAFRVLALVSCGVCLVCTILIKDRNKSVGSVHMAFDMRLFKRLEFWLLLGWGFFSMLGYIVLLFSLPNYATSIGLTARQGALAGAMLNLGQGIGRPFVGYFSDSIGRINMAGGCTFVCGVLCLAFWVFAKNLGALVSFAVIVGTVSGTFWATIGPVGAEVVGLQILPSALSITWIFLVLPCTFAEPIGLELRADRGNIYLHAQIFTGVMYIAGAVCLWFLRAWKIREVERQTLEQQQQTSRERGVLDNKEVNNLNRSASRGISVKSTAKSVRGLYAWQRV